MQIRSTRLFFNGVKILVFAAVLLMLLLQSWNIVELYLARSYTGNDGLFSSPFLNQYALAANAALFLLGAVLLLAGWCGKGTSRLRIRHEQLFFTGIAIIVIALTMFVVMLQLKTALYWVTDYDYVPEEEIWNPFLNHRILPYNTALLVSGGVLTLAGWFGNDFPRWLFRNAYKKPPVK